MAALILPVLPSQFTNHVSVLPPTTTATAVRTSAPTTTPRQSATPSPVPTLTFTPTAIPSLTLTPTYGEPVLPTSIVPTATATPEVKCTITVDKNVNLRSGPSTTEKLLLTVPYDVVLPVKERSADKAWWHVTYNGQEGWVNGDFVTPDAACRQVPTVNAP